MGGNATEFSPAIARGCSIVGGSPIRGGLWNAAPGKLGLSLGVAFSVAAAAGLAAALVSAPWLFGKRLTSRQCPRVRIPWRPIAGIGVAMACMYIGDAAFTNFSSVYSLGWWNPRGNQDTIDSHPLTGKCGVHPPEVQPWSTVQSRVAS